MGNVNMSPRLETVAEALSKDLTSGVRLGLIDAAESSDELNLIAATLEDIKQTGGSMVVINALINHPLITEPTRQWLKDRYINLKGGA